MMKCMVLILLAVLMAGCSAFAPKPLLPEPTDVSVNWGSLHLGGKLVFICYQENGNQLIQLNLSTGKSTVLFQAPEKGMLNAAAVSPDGAQIALAYSPPPPKGQALHFPTIALLPANGSSSPKALIRGVGPGDSYFNPAWTPDGKALYATHYHSGAGGNDAEDTRIEKISLDGKATSILDHATWPEISPDGQKMAYLTIDPTSGFNHLAIANADGSNPSDLLSGAPFPTVDAHRFTPDGQSLVFSATIPTVSFQPSPEQLLGFEIAQAHATLPSDLFATTIAFGDFHRITYTHDNGLYPAISPDGKMLAFISQSGIYIVGIDGDGLQQISNQLVIGTIDWVR